jgi:hypothetical protein
LLTPEARLAFPALFVPKPRTREVKMDPKGVPIPPELYYQATLLLPPTVDLRPFHTAMLAACTAKFGREFRLPANKNPIRDCAEKDLAGYDEGWHFVAASSKTRRPGVVNRLNEPVTDPAMVYSGMWIRAYLNAFAWNHPSGGKGVSFGLTAVQLIRDDERLDGHVDAATLFEPLDDLPTVPGEDTASSLFGG